MTDAHRERTVNKYHTSVALAVIYLLVDFSQQLGVSMRMLVAAKLGAGGGTHERDINKRSPRRHTAHHLSTAIGQFRLWLAFVCIFVGIGVFCSTVRSSFLKLAWRCFVLKLDAARCSQPLAQRHQYAESWI